MYCMRNFIKKFFLISILPASFLISGCSPKVSCNYASEDAKIPLILNPSSSSQTNSHPINFAFDGNKKGNSFWESKNNYPHVIKLNYSKGTIINSYSISSGPDEPERMPRNWVLEASCDGEKWVKIDSRRNQDLWEVNETKQFTTSIKKAKDQKSTGFKYYRFQFTSGFFHVKNPKNIIRVYEINLENT